MATREEKDRRRERFTWGAGDVIIQRAPNKPPMPLEDQEKQPKMPPEGKAPPV